MNVAEVIGLFVVLAVGTYVGLPILRARRASPGQGVFRGTAHADRLRELEAQKDNVLAAIKDIEFDHQMGKLSAEDFRALRDRYKAEAIALLKQIDELNGKLSAADRTAPISFENLKGHQGAEEGIQRFRRERHPEMVATAHPRFCAKCGQPVTRGDRFCSHCGFRL